MSESAEILLTAFALVFVIEGLLYAFFPDMLKQMLAVATAIPPEKLRLLGLFVASIGVFFTWLIQAYI